MEKSRRMEGIENEDEYFLESKNRVMKSISDAEKDILYEEEVGHLNDFLRVLNVNEFGMLLASFAAESEVIESENGTTIVHVYMTIGEKNDN